MSHHPLADGRTVVIVQPSYLPWLGYFAQMWRSDVFVIYDDVQYDKHGWRNRNRIKTPQGSQWLTVPVLHHGKGRPLISEVQIDNRQPWARRHLQAISQNYSKAPYFADYVPRFTEVLSRDWTRLVELDVAFLQILCDMLGLRRDVIRASSLGIEGAGAERLVDICRHLGAARFFEGAAGQDYIDSSLFTAAGITLEYQDYRHPVYPQLHGEFVSHLSVVDLLFNVGPQSLETLAQ